MDEGHSVGIIHILLLITVITLIFFFITEDLPPSSRFSVRPARRLKIIFGRFVRLIKWITVRNFTEASLLKSRFPDSISGSKKLKIFEFLLLFLIQKNFSFFVQEPVQHFLRTKIHTIASFVAKKNSIEISTFLVSFRDVWMKKLGKLSIFSFYLWQRKMILMRQQELCK